jgi:hypothetical protein
MNRLEDLETMSLRRRAARVAALAFLAAAVASPAAAAPPNRVEIDVFTIALDLEHGLVMFWNITRDDFCDWEATEFDGPAPVTMLIPAHEHVVRGEILMVNWGGTTSLELWQLDEDADLSGPCPDTDGQSGPWATGTANQTGHDNDVDVSLTRTNAFGDHLNGSVVDVDGNSWRFMSHFVARIDRSEEFHLNSEQFTLAGGH